MKVEGAEEVVHVVLLVGAKTGKGYLGDQASTRSSSNEFNPASREKAWAVVQK